MGALDMPETRAASLVSTGAQVAHRRAARRFAVDFVTALFVFAICTGLFGIEASNAFPAPPPPELSFASTPLPLPTMLMTVPTFPGTVDGPGPLQMLTLLGFAFASLVATNLAIGRHLVSAYARPNRGRNLK